MNHIFQDLEIGRQFKFRYATPVERQFVWRKISARRAQLVRAKLGRRKELTPWAFVPIVVMGDTEVRRAA